MKKWQVVVGCVAIAVIVVVVFFFLARSSAAFGSLNDELSWLVFGSPDKHCDADADCVLKQGTCENQCLCPGEAVNKAWSRRCFVPTPAIQMLCEPCPPAKVVCIEHTCTTVPQDLS